AFQRKWDCKRVEDYAKVSHFEQDVKQFFTQNNLDKFIIRYQHKKSDDLTQFLQIKWILETSHDSYYKNYNKDKDEDEKKYKNEDEEKYSNIQNSKGKKLIILIVRNVHKLQHPFPIIFAKKWKTVFVDSLTNQSSLSFGDIIQNNKLTMIDDPSSIPILKKNLQRAFYYLKLPSFHSTLLKIKHGFGDFSVLSKPMHDMLIERLKKEVNKMTDNNTICEILEKGLYKKSQPHKNEYQGRFIQNYENIVDSLITKGWLQVLLALCENCYLKAALDNLNQSDLSSIFVNSAKDEQFIPISDQTNTLNKHLHFFKVKVLYKAQFPFSWNFHLWSVSQIQESHVWHTDADKWVHEHIVGLKKRRNRATIDDEILKIAYSFKKILDVHGKQFFLLNNFEKEECAMYTKDVIRGMFHRYISVEANNDIPDIVKGIVFWVGEIIIDETSLKISIPLIEVILYYLEDVIGNYVQLLSLCDDPKTWSSIKQLSNVSHAPLIQLTKITLKLSEYFLWPPSQINDVENIPDKIHLICDALQIIASFLHERYSEEKEYQEFLSAYRQLQIKNLGLKHFWTIDCYSVSSKDNLVAVNTLMLAKRGFATGDILIEMIDSVIGCHSLSISLVRKAIYFIRDLLYTVQRVEPLNEQIAKLMFQNVIGYLLCRFQEFPKDYSINILKQQALEFLLVKIKGVDPTFIEKHGFENASLSRVYERMLMNQTISDCNMVSNPNTIEKIEAISKLKVQLTKHIEFLCRYNTIEEFPNGTLNSTLASISDGLSYFKSKKTQFGNASHLYEQYLHIWFLKQCCMLKGPCWTQNFFTQSDIRKKYPIFASETQSCVFSELKPRDKHTWLETPFDKAFANKYHNFKKKLSSIDTIKNCVITEKEDFVPLLIAALFVASDTSRISPFKNAIDIQAQLLSCNIVNPGSSVACITNLLKQDPIDTRSKMFYSSNAEDTTHPIVARICIHWLGTLQITKTNPFTILLNNPDQYENQRLPGESSKNGDVKISTFSLYYCRNGHALLMKKRGTVRRVTKCTDPWCSAKIDEPELLAHQTNVHFEIDNRYVLRDPNVDFDLKSQLDISPVICGLLQLLSSLTMLLRDVSELKGCPILIKLLQSSDNITELLWRRAKEKFMLLCKMTGLNEEQLSIALHRWLCEFGQWYNQAGPEKFQVVTPTIIHNFEKMFEKEYISYFTNQKYWNQYFHIIREKKEEMIFQNDKEFLVRNLFLVTRRMSSEELLFRLCDNIELANKYPLLFNTLKIIDKLECLQSLSSIGQWMKYCYMEYSGRLTYRECQNTTMNTIISNCHNLHIIQEWQRFRQCWNVFVNERANIGSAEIKIPKLSDNDKEVSFNHCTAHKNTPGLFIVAIVEIHRKKKQEEKDEQKYDNNPTSIVISKSLFDITNQDVVYVDKEEVDNIIRSWYCPTLEYGQDYRNEWIDFESIENEIYDRAIFGRHEINISVAMFEYANELTIQSILDNIDRCYPSFKKCTFNSNELEFVQSFFDDPQQVQHVFEITYQII
ncbi:hypothetical protein RFI_37678, partial [Reticulomyxa filosa]